MTLSFRKTKISQSKFCEHVFKTWLNKFFQSSCIIVNLHEGSSKECDTEHDTENCEKDVKISNDAKTIVIQRILAFLMEFVFFNSIFLFLGLCETIPLVWLTPTSFYDEIQAFVLFVNFISDFSLLFVGVSLWFV